MRRSLPNSRQAAPSWWLTLCQALKQRLQWSVWRWLLPTSTTFSSTWRAHAHLRCTTVHTLARYIMSFNCSHTCKVHHAIQLFTHLQGTSCHPTVHILARYIMPSNCSHTCKVHHAIQLFTHLQSASCHLTVHTLARYIMPSNCSHTCKVHHAIQLFTHAECIMPSNCSHTCKVHHAIQLFTHLQGTSCHSTVHTLARYIMPSNCSHNYTVHHAIQLFTTLVRYIMSSNCSHTCKVHHAIQLPTRLHHVIQLHMQGVMPFNCSHTCKVHHAIQLFTHLEGVYDDKLSTQLQIMTHNFLFTLLARNISVWTLITKLHWLPSKKGLFDFKLSTHTRNAHQVVNIIYRIRFNNKDYSHLDTCDLYLLADNELLHLG